MPSNRKKRSKLERALDDVVSVSMAFCHAVRSGSSSADLMEKLLRVTRKLEKATGKK